MAKKKKVEKKYYQDDFEVLKSVKYCWDRSLYFYPVVIKDQTRALKFVPKVRIAYREGSVKNGKVIVSTVLLNRLNQMYKVLNDNKIIDLKTFNDFTYSGNYKRSEINN